MITPMTHATLVCLKQDAPDLLDALRNFAGMHLKLIPNQHHDILELEEEIKECNRFIQKLETIEEPVQNAASESPEAMVAHCGRLYQILSRAQTLDQKLLKEEHSWAPFGTVKTETLSALKEQGLSVEFYRAAVSPVDLPAQSAWLTADPGFGVAVSSESLEQVETASLKMPVRTPQRIQQLRTHIAKIQQASHEELARVAGSLPEIKRFIDQKADQLDFLKAKAGMGDEQELAWIEGFIPSEKLSELEQQASKWNAALQTREPVLEDPTPTLLKQSNFVSWIQPIFNFLGVTPGYNEVDVGWSFLIFLSIFSGMIIGDAGYGFVLLLTVLGINLWKPASRGKFANLLYLMGGATVIWGLLTGNIFGIMDIPAIFPSLSPIADPKATMNVCFIMGAGHLTLAHLWNLWNKRKSLQALAEFGWIGSTWTMYCVTGQMVLGWEALPAFTGPLFITSMALIIIFMTPPKAFKEQWVDHMMLPLSFVNNFVDVVSYVRLYAVGMATFALASSFNSMILAGSSERNLLANGVMMIVLILGHGLNFILAGMGVLVHGIRLNTLEFSSHLGLTWSGIPYTPFKKRDS
ncbi:V-type ATPase 116kDa subunit family protein [Kiritimatiellaeota bacterium B1221]|nr:V-type ATPase 116kDa subunit family protein [Kiritimatiellaeota bacterium B1221]